jgi:alkanesulfonate monooxygenase SsuD/methylene tetrahydromethanopterin reductase-like flavin-dependent oxidoreductase (luciferase family)
MGVNVPNFGPGTAPGLLRRWAQTVEGLGFDLLMISDHIAVTFRSARCSLPRTEPSSPRSATGR